jgi:membrane protein implicated in regulation of membrane protease activity
MTVRPPDAYLYTASIPIEMMPNWIAWIIGIAHVIAPILSACATLLAFISAARSGQLHPTWISATWVSVTSLAVFVCLCAFGLEIAAYAMAYYNMNDLNSITDAEYGTTTTIILDLVWRQHSSRYSLKH